MNTRIFGPIAWTVLQSLPRMWPRDKRLEEYLQESACVVMYSMAVVLPCRYCRESYRRFIQLIDIRKWLQNEDRSVTPLRPGDVEYWLYLLHNLVNQKLDRRWERNKDAVYDGRVREDERGYMDTLFDWLFILFMNYEDLVNDRHKDAGDSEEKRIADALQLVGTYASQREGKWLSLANRRDVTLGAMLDCVIFDPIYEKNVCGGNVAGGKGGAQTTAMDQKKWRKTCWYIFHVAHLVRALRPATPAILSRHAQQALNSLDQFFVRDASRSLLRQKDAFASLYKIRCAYDASCPSYDQIIERFETYRAS